MDNSKLYTKCEVKKGFLGTPWFTHGLNCTEATASDLPPPSVPDMIGYTNGTMIQDMTANPGLGLHNIVDSIEIHQSTGDIWNNERAPKGTFMWCLKGHFPDTNGKPDTPIPSCLASGTFETKQ